MREILSILFLILLVVLTLYRGNSRNNLADKKESRIRYYLSDMLISGTVLLFFFLLNRQAFLAADAGSWGKGVLAKEQLVTIAYAFAITRLLIPFFSNHTGEKSELSTGLPLILMPVRGIEYFGFMIFLVAGVVVEELLFRQLAFHAFHQALGWRGDALVLTGAVLFSAGHIYQGKQGVMANFVTGLLLGKVYLITENILTPIVIHLLLNLGIVAPLIWRDNSLRG